MHLDNDNGLSMAHISSLSTELLSIIFRITFEGIKASSVLNWEDAATPPDLLNILLVWSRWKKVAVATPSLWTFIEINGRSFQGVQERVKKNLERSKNCTLDVVVRGVRGLRTEKLDAFNSLFEEVAQHAHRWGTLRFQDMTTRALDFLDQTHLPRLVSLAITGVFKAQRLRFNTPLLKRYVAPEGNTKLLSFKTPLPVFTHLRHSLTSKTAQMVLHHLQRSQHVLTALSLVFLEPPGTQFSIRLEDGTEFLAENLGLSLPTLTEYIVTFSPIGPWSWNALQIAHMPHLRRLDIHWETFIPLYPNKAIPFMPQLHSLHIFASDPQGFKDVAPPLIAATPGLEKLSLIQTYSTLSDYDEEWMYPLLVPTQDPLTTAWPQLVMLRLCGMCIPQWDDLGKISTGRPAFKWLSVDSVCWENSTDVGQDSRAFGGNFDFVVENEP
ncbi:hypothetical protein FRC01_004093 [Tulasnella sp. 417]|nr:hypothetical protein FRC01_004093 [Tulasnella sp. 417]